MTRKTIKNILVVTLPTLLLLFLFSEFLIFRFIIPGSETPLYVFDDQFKLLRFQAHTSGLFTAGRLAGLRGRWRANNCGWNSEIDYAPGAGEQKPLIAIIGDSYVEALQVNLDENFISELRRLLGDDFPVYSFGISGAPLSHYVHLSRYVNQVFQPRTLIILLCHNDFHESLANLGRKPHFLQIVRENGAFREIPPTRLESSAFLRICRGSAVFRYLEQNCGVAVMVRNSLRWFNRPPQPPVYNANIDVAAVSRERDDLRAGVEYLVSRLRAENPEKRIIMMMDAPRFDIYINNVANSNIWWLHEMVQNACRDSRVEFLDLTTPFSRHFQQNQQYLHNNEDAHWNRLAHHLAARALADKLKETGALSREID